MNDEASLLVLYTRLSAAAPAPAPALLKRAATALIAATGQPDAWYGANELARLAAPMPDQPPAISWRVRGRVGI